MQKITFSAVSSAKENVVTQHEQTWDEFKSALHAHLTDHPRTKDGDAVIGAIFREGAHPRQPMKYPGKKKWRHQALVEQVTCIILDIEDHDYGTDEGAALSSEIGECLGKLAGTSGAPSYALYSTFNHGVPFVLDSNGNEKPKWKKNHPRMRLIVPLSSPLSPKEARSLWAYLSEGIPGTDKVCSDLSRLQYTPRKRNPESTLDPWLKTHTSFFLDPSKLPLWRYSLDTGIEPFKDDEDLIERCKRVLKSVDVEQIPELYHEATLKALATLEAQADYATVETFFARVPRGHGTKLRKVVKKTDPLTVQGRSIEFIGSLDDSNLEQALSHVHVPETGGYETWRNVGMALKDYANEGHISQDEALELYVLWSREQPGYESDDDVADHFEGFTGSGITIGTLIHLAREGGWRPPRGSSSLTGSGQDGLIRGDQAEVAALFQRAYQEEAPLPSITFATSDVKFTREQVRTIVDSVPCNPLVKSGGDLYRWCKEEGIYVVLPIEKVTSDVSDLAQTNPPVGKGGLLRVSGVFSSGVYSILSARVATSVPDGDKYFENAHPCVSLRDKTLVLANVRGHDGMRWWTADHHPIWRTRHKIDREYDPSAKCPRFLAFLDDVWEGCEDLEERKTCLQEYVGAGLIGKGSKTHRAMLLSGNGSNGKSVLIEIIESLFDDRDTVHIAPQTMTMENPNWHPLLSARINTLAEIDRKALLSTSVLKKALSGDSLSAPRKYKEALSGKCNAIHLWGANEFPYVKDVSRGFWRRWIILDFPHQFETNPIKGQKKAKSELGQSIIKEELGGILNWALDGAIRIHAKGYKNITIPPSHHAHVSEWRGETDPLRTWAQTFAEEGERSTASSLYPVYKTWCEESGYKPIAITKFYRSLKTTADSLGVDTVTANGSTRYAIGLVQKEEDAPGRLPPEEDLLFDLS